MKLSTIYSALLATSFFVMGAAMAGDESEVKTAVKVIKLHDAKTHLSSSDGDNVITLNFEGELDDAKIDELISQLPAEKQEKMRDILANLKIETATDGNGKVKVISLGDTNAHFVNVLGDELEHNIEVLSDGGEAVKAFSFSFGGDKGMEIELIKSLIKKANLTPEQIVELQDLLATK
jgi:hypothetical protein